MLGDEGRELRRVRDHGEAPEERDREREPVRDEPDRERAEPRDGHAGRRRLRTPDPVAGDPTGDAAEPARGDHGEGDEGRVGAVRVELVAGEDEEPRPHRVELPHVPEVAERGEADAAVVERASCLARIEHRARERERALADSHEHEQAAGRA